MKVLILPLGADTGGVNWQITDAFRDQEGWSVRSMISSVNYIDYPRDLEFSLPALNEHWRAADVIHLSHEFYRLRRIERLRLPNRPRVIHYHGTGFRENPDDFIRHQRAHQAIGLVATLDLWLLAPENVEWLPCPYDLDWLAFQRISNGVDKGSKGVPEGVHRQAMVKVVHAPTARKIKSTEAFLRAVEKLQEEGHDLEVDIIEGVSWAECLVRKADADIYYDQVQLGYGNNAIEAWGMGIPVIAGAADRTIQEMRSRFGGRLPFLQASEQTIYDQLKALVLSVDLRSEYGERGLDHVRTFHDQKVVVEQLKDVYQRALQRR